jgi:hypothetical protein
VLGRSGARLLEREQVLQIQVTGIREGRHTQMLYVSRMNVNARSRNCFLIRRFNDLTM